MTYLDYEITAHVFGVFGTDFELDDNGDLDGIETEHTDDLDVWDLEVKYYTVDAPQAAQIRFTTIEVAKEYIEELERDLALSGN